MLIDFHGIRIQRAVRNGRCLCVASHTRCSCSSYTRILAGNNGQAAIDCQFASAYLQLTGQRIPPLLYFWYVRRSSTSAFTLHLCPSPFSLLFARLLPLNVCLLPHGGSREIEILMPLRSRRNTTNNNMCCHTPGRHSVPAIKTRSRCGGIAHGRQAYLEPEKPRYVDLRPG